MRKGEIVAQQKAALMKVLDLEVTRKAGPGGRLFGSIEQPGHSRSPRSRWLRRASAILLPAPIATLALTTSFGFIPKSRLK